MKATFFWKNFKLGEEIGVSGTFIYNSLRRYHEMRKLNYTDEVFDFLYTLSVGLERLLKIAVVLFEHHESINQEELEKSLITHSHLDLLSRIEKHVSINLGSSQIDLLALLGTFYKSLRYDRFALSSAYDSNKETEALFALLRKHLKVDIPRGSSDFEIENEDRYRRFIRRTVLKISKSIYEVIETRARAIGLFTYELRHGSKAETVFLREIDISDEDVLWKELLVFLMNTKSSSGYLDFLREITPLGFDSALVGDYLDCFQSEVSKAFVMDELETLYEEIEGGKSARLELMKMIGASNVYFCSSDDDLADEENL